MTTYRTRKHHLGSCLLHKYKDLGSTPRARRRARRHRVHSEPQCWKGSEENPEGLRASHSSQSQVLVRDKMAAPEI